jgi:hypothetical protein
LFVPNSRTLPDLTPRLVGKNNPTILVLRNKRGLK